MSLTALVNHTLLYRSSFCAKTAITDSGLRGGELDPDRHEAKRLLLENQQKTRRATLQRAGLSVGGLHEKPFGLSGRLNDGKAVNSVF